MIHKSTMLAATLFLMAVFLHAEEVTSKIENSDTVEAIAEDAAKIAQEENISDETNASETITPLSEEKPKPVM